MAEKKLDVPNALHFLHKSLKERIDEFSNKCLELRKKEQEYLEKQEAKVLQKTLVKVTPSDVSEKIVHKLKEEYGYSSPAEKAKVHATAWKIHNQKKSELEKGLGGAFMSSPEKPVAPKSGVMGGEHGGALPPAAPSTPPPSPATPAGTGTVLKTELKKEHLGFEKLKNKLAHKSGVTNPAALAAKIGRDKYGKEGMAEKSAEGHKKTEKSAEASKSESSKSEPVEKAMSPIVVARMAANKAKAKKPKLQEISVSTSVAPEASAAAPAAATGGTAAAKAELPYHTFGKLTSKVQKADVTGGMLGTPSGAGNRDSGSEMVMSEKPLCKGCGHEMSKKEKLMSYTHKLCKACYGMSKAEGRMSQGERKGKEDAYTKEQDKQHRADPVINQGVLPDDASSKEVSADGSGGKITKGSLKKAGMAMTKPKLPKVSAPTMPKAPAMGAGSPQAAMGKADLKPGTMLSSGAPSVHLAAVGQPTAKPAKVQSMVEKLASKMGPKLPGKK